MAVVEAVPSFVSEKTTQISSSKLPRTQKYTQLKETMLRAEDRLVMEGGVVWTVWS